MWSNPKSLSCVCAAPSAPVNIQSPATGRKLSLSNREGKSIESSWAKIPDKDALGRAIFRHIFTNKPSLKRLWGLDKESLEDLAENPTFQKHARNFATFLDVAVKSLSLDGVYAISLARTVGKKHVLFKEVSFDAENWLLFKTAVIEALTPYITPDIKQQWFRFIMFLVTEVKDAYNKEVQNLRTAPPKPLAPLGPHTNGFVTPKEPSSQLESLKEEENAGEYGPVGNMLRRQSAMELRADLNHIQDCIKEEEENDSAYNLSAALKSE